MKSFVTWSLVTVAVTMFATVAVSVPMVAVTKKEVLVPPPVTVAHNIPVPVDSSA